MSSQPIDPGGLSDRRVPLDVYMLEQTTPDAPRLPGSVAVAPSVDQLLDVLAADLMVHAENCRRRFGDFHLALSGGEVPEALYRRLMVDPNYRRLPWPRTQLWLTEDRCVDFEDERSRFKLVRETIVDHTDIPPSQVHPILATAEDPAALYEQELREALEWREPGQDRLDFVLLTLGLDGRVAGLAPFDGGDDRRLVAVTEDGVLDPPAGVSMLPALINAARFVAIVATGEPLAAVVGSIEDHHGACLGPSRATPVSLIEPLAGELRWYLDAAAVPA